MVSLLPNDWKTFFGGDMIEIGDEMNECDLFYVISFNVSIFGRFHKSVIQRFINGQQMLFQSHT